MGSSVLRSKTIGTSSHAKCPMARRAALSIPHRCQGDHASRPQKVKTQTMTSKSKSASRTPTPRFSRLLRLPAIGSRRLTHECVPLRSRIVRWPTFPFTKGYLNVVEPPPRPCFGSHNRKRIVLDEAHRTENPVDSLSPLIKNSLWHFLTRRIDDDGVDSRCHFCGP
jgi:hypothetical protein